MKASEFNNNFTYQRKHLKRYFAFTRGGIMDSFAYAGNNFLWLFGEVVGLIVLIFLWVSIFDCSSTDTINGFTLPMMLFYLISARLTNYLTSSSSTFFILGEGIREGTVTSSLTRPINYRFSLLFQSLGNMVGTFLVLFLPVYIACLVVFYFALHIDFPAWYNILFFLVSILFAFIILESFDFMIGSLAFFTNALFGIMLIKNVILSFLSGSYVPIDFFPTWAQFIVRFILPFSSLTETPVFIIMGKYTIVETLWHLAIQFGWVIVLNLIDAFIYSRSVKHLVSAGG